MSAATALLAAFCFEWFGARAVNRPSSPDPSANRTKREAEDVFPVADGSRMALERQFQGFPSIARLLARRGPSDIARTVASLVVNSVDAVFGRRARSDVRNVALKAPSPAFTDGDSTRAVILPLGTVRVGASVNHASPYAVFPCARFMMAYRRDISLRSILIAEAAAAWCVPAFESMVFDIGDVAAIAATPPHEAFPWLVHSFDDGQSVIDMSTDVSGPLVSSRWYSAVSHAVSSLMGDVVVRGRESLSTIAGSVLSYQIYVNMTHIELVSM